NPEQNELKHEQQGQPIVLEEIKKSDIFEDKDESPETKDERGKKERRKERLEQEAELHKSSLKTTKEKANNPKEIYRKAVLMGLLFASLIVPTVMGSPEARADDGYSNILINAAAQGARTFSNEITGNLRIAGSVLSSIQQEYTQYNINTFIFKNQCERTMEHFIEEQRQAKKSKVKDLSKENQQTMRDYNTGRKILMTPEAAIEYQEEYNRKFRDIEEKLQDFIEKQENDKNVKIRLLVEAYKDMNDNLNIQVYRILKNAENDSLRLQINSLIDRMTILGNAACDSFTIFLQNIHK
ncbi:MAG: hypothetical protein WC389_22590, partial [Lutibacter sp.]